MIKQEAFLRIFRALDNRRGLGAGYVSVTFSGVCFGPGPLARTCTGPVTRVIGSTFLPPPLSTRRSPPKPFRPLIPLGTPLTARRHCHCSSSALCGPQMCLCQCVSGACRVAVPGGHQHEEVTTHTPTPESPQRCGWHANALAYQK